MTDTTPHPAHTATRRRWPRVAAGIAALLVVGIALCEVAGWPFLRGPLQSKASQAAGVPVVLDAPFKLHLLFRPSLSVERLQIGAAKGIDVPHLLSASQVHVTWRWLDLWRWQRSGDVLRLRELRADTLDANLLRLADGRASWQLGAAKPVPKPDDKPEAGLPRIGSLLVGSGRIVFDDRVLDADLRVELRGGEGAAGTGSAITGTSAYQATADGHYRKLPVHLRARAGGALPLLRDDGDEGDGADAGSSTAPAVPLRVEGEVGRSRLLFDGKAAALMGARRLDGAVRLSGPSLAAVGEPVGVTLPRTPAFDLAGHLDHDGQVWHLRADRAAIGQSLLAGDFRYDAGRSPPLLSGRLNGSRLALADLGPAVGTDGEGAAPGTPVAAAAKAAKPDRVLPQRSFDLPSLKAMNADVQVAIDEFDLGTTALAPLRALKTHVVLQGGLLQLQALQATVAGGQVAGSSQLDGRGQPAQWAADLRFRGLDVAGWIRGVEAPAGAASGATSATSATTATTAKRAAPPEKSAQALRQQREAARQGSDTQVRSYLTGELSGDLKVTGRGNSTAQILGTMDGSAHAMVRDGTISHLVTEAAGLDIAQGLGMLVRGDDALPLRCARLDLAIHNGVAEAQHAVVDNADSTVKMAGSINLRDESLALRAESRPKDFSPMTLRAPVLLTGTLSHPKIGLEAKRLGGRAAAAVALGVLAAPVAALIPFIDFGTRDKGDPCTDAAALAAAERAASAAGPARK